MRLATLIIGFCLSLPAMANWQINQTNSTVSFITVKNEHTVENHNFTSFQGNLAEGGDVTLSIDLTSVDTNIGIRDERMKEFLFETALYPAATFSAQLDAKGLTSLKVGESKSLTVNGDISLHGKKKATAISVMVTKVSATKMLVVSTKALLIKANDFALTAGVLKLKELAGLPSIGETVPVSFVLTFDKAL